MDKNIMKVVKQVNRRNLTNNTQRVLFALLTATTEWVPRTSLRIPSVGARIRDLRKTQFGGFRVQCMTAAKLERKGVRNSTSTRQTFYRLDPASVTSSKVNRVFEGVIAANVK